LLLPVIAIRNGDGPTVLFTGGNHGDEYEGPIALRKLANELKAEDIQGQVIIVPYLNYPAVLAGTRLSPVDGLNMNRSFPGNPEGSMTQEIADFVFRELVMRSDVVLDFHSGGNSMIFEPCTVLHQLEDTEQLKKTLLAAKNFGAPISLGKFFFLQNLAEEVLSVRGHSKLRKTVSVICCVISKFYHQTKSLSRKQDSCKHLILAAI